MKKLIPAISMLLVAACLLGSSTFAWFSMNTTVTATGMSVTAKSNATYLLIKEGSVANAAAVQADNKTTANATNASAAQFPAAHNAITNLTEADTVGNWYYKNSTDPAVYGGSGKETDATPLTAFTDYVLVNEFNLTIAKGGNKMNGLKVKHCTITTTGDQAVKVLVATATAVEEFSGTGADGSVILQSSLTDSELMTVKVYIYWDGNDEDVYTNGIADLTNTSVEITFTGTIA